MATFVEVTLTGGQPWGFRIQGGYTAAHPVRISRVLPGGKAVEFNVEEGDVIDAVNGHSVAGMSHVDVQQLIRNTGDTLTLTLKRPIPNGTANINQNREFILPPEMLMVDHPFDDFQNSIVHDGAAPQTSVWTKDNNQELLVEPSHKVQSQQQSNIQVNNLSDRYPTNVKRIEDGGILPNDAVLIDQTMTVEGDRIHTDSYYAIPVQGETTTTTTVKPAHKYEGIGPTTVEGIPVGLRTGIKEEHASDWYKTMFKSLHKAARNEDRFHSGGYVSEPDLYQRGLSPVPASANLDPRKPIPNGPEKNHLLKVNDEFTKIRSSSNEELTKSKYTVPLRPISEYEPGYSSIVEREALMRTKQIKPSDKPFYLGTDGYDSDSTIIKKSGHSQNIDPEKQKILYREIQRGGDIPLSGLCMPAPKKPAVFIVGPPPPPPVYEISTQLDQVIRRHEKPCYDERNNLNQMPNTSEEKNKKEYQIPERIPKPVPSEVTKTATNGQRKTFNQDTFARVLYDFRSQNGRELMLQKGDIVKITHQMDKNWYEGFIDGKLGIFPVTYVEIIPTEHELHSPPSEFLECKARAKYDFQTQTSVELPLKKGDIVSLLRQVDQNWFEGMIDNRKGIFPISYVEILDSPNNSQVSSSNNSSPAATRPGSVIRNCQDKSPCGQEPPLIKETFKPTSEERQQSIQALPYNEDSLQSVLYKALYVYTPQNRDELELQEGDTVAVVKMCDDGWFVGTSQRTGLFGTFPGNYVEKVC